MYNLDPKSETRSLMFFGAFHLGVPLSLCHTRQSTGWEQFRSELADRFTNTVGNSYQVVAGDYDPETRFPLGTPLMLRRNGFFNLLDMQGTFQRIGLLLPENYSIDNMIWICPTGVVLLSGRLSFPKPDSLDRLRFEDDFIERRYGELAYMFTEIAEVALAPMSADFLRSAVCCKADLELCRAGIEHRKRIQSSTQGGGSVAELLRQDISIYELFESILIDIYYIDFTFQVNSPQATHPNRENESLAIANTDSEIVSENALYTLHITIAFSCFVMLLWLIRHLGEKANELRSLLVRVRSPRADIRELKVFHIFCQEFFDESNPIRIRLTEYYLNAMEEFGRNSRVPALRTQVAEQLATIEQMVDWIDGAIRETRNFKIGLAAVLLAIVSLMSVAATLVSTVDVRSQLDATARLVWIGVGLITGVLGSLVIYLMPFAGIGASHRRLK